MRTKYLRTSARWTTTFLGLATLTIVAQQPHSPVQADRGFLADGPFLFAPGLSPPTTMNAFDDRPVVKSPDGRLGVTVTGPKESWGAWVTISPSSFPDGPIQVWPLQASADVLWSPDSRAFALTDKRYANLSYVLVYGTGFRMGESESGLGVPIVDLTPIVREVFEEQAQKYYEHNNYDTRLFYAVVLRWIGDDNLLVGVSARTSGPVSFPDRGIKEWDFAYLVDVPSKKVIRSVDKEQLLSEYRIKVSE